MVTSTFAGFKTRALAFTSDSTGLAIITPTRQLYFAFDGRFFSRLRSFCISMAQLIVRLSGFKSVYQGLRGGYFCVLHVKGIGFKVFYSFLRRALYFFLGYNHLTKFRVPELVEVKPLKTYILVFTFRKDLFGKSVYYIRHLRFPDPYRGKGIRYRYQIMRFKPGKQR